MLQFKVKKFKSKTKCDAMSAYKLSEGRYKQVDEYITYNNLSANTTVFIEELPDGKIELSARAPAGDTLYSSTSPDGEYVKASLEPGKAPTIQGLTTNSIIVDGFAVACLISAVTACVWQVAALVFAIQDRKWGRLSSGGSNNANSN